MTRRPIVFLDVMCYIPAPFCCAVLVTILSVTATAQTWSPVTYIGSYAQEAPSVPSFDPAGNAWVGLGNTATLPFALQVIQSNGVSGSWQQPVTLLQTSYAIYSGPEVKVDTLGTVNVIYTLFNASANANQLQSFRYVPGVGWQGPVVAYSSQNYPFVVGSAIDPNNNLVVIFAEGRNEDGPYETWSIVYTSATQTWGQPQRLSTAHASTELWNVASSPDGANIMLVYASTVGPAGDIYSWKYVPSTQNWVGAAVPGTGKPGFLISNGPTSAFGHFPLAMDSSGNATLLADYVNGEEGPCTVYGFRYENGKWGEGVELLPLQDAREAIDYYGALAVDSSGIAVGAVNTSLGGGVVYAFRYTPDEGWDIETVAAVPNIIYGMTAVSFLGSSPGEAVVVYVTEYNISSSVYLNGAWSAAAPITSQLYGFNLAQAPGGQDLLVFQSSANNPAGATWLNP
jgi:hypothetical protein